MIENLQENLGEVPRKITIIYSNPVCHDKLLRAGFILETALPQKINIYSISP